MSRNGSPRRSYLIIYPALDLRGGRVVRLKQGRPENESVYFNDPVEAARHWQAEGATWLHVVDLDGAFGKENHPNVSALARILAAIRIPIQFGGGLRSLEQIRQAFELGVQRVVIGTLAIEQPQLVATAVRQFGIERIAVAIDLRDGRVARRGWQETSDIAPSEFAERIRALGVQRVVVTDIARDGMLSGIDAAAMARFARETGLRVIASGGVASLDDLRALRAGVAEGVEGVIVGQALYTGAFTLREAMAMNRWQEAGGRGQEAGGRNAR